MKDVQTEEEIVDAISNANNAMWKRQYVYLKKNHSPEIVVIKLLKTYEMAM